ncbi:MAG: Ig-like domain-containing protein, partial [Verrucomicrobia bacterium]|nr:Ig-like domain-containing protein [Verrucomicrobiota bacterium]
AWTPTSIGPVSIVAIATDDKTNATVSATANVTVTDSTAPTITLGVTPGSNGTTGTTLPAGATRNVLVNATAFSGRAISRVEFYINGVTKVGEKTVAPYNFRYVAPAEAGTYVLTARAIDNAGLARDVYYTFNVTAAVGVGPTVRLLTPTNNATVIPNTAVTLAASAVATTGGSVANLQFYANGAPVSGAIIPPNSFTTSYTPTTTGNFTFDAIATDDRGNTTVSNSVRITAAFGTPTITIASPSTAVAARSTPNVPFNVTFTATPGTGATIFLVELLVDGQQVATRLPNANGSAAYTFQWTPVTAQIGAHEITARVTDSNSLSAVTAAILKVNVANPVGAPPTLSGISPANAAIVQSLSTVNFSVTAAPGGAATVSSVEFFLNDVSIGTATKEQATNVWRRAYDLGNFDLSGLTIDPNTGRYPVSLYAIARDNNGNQTLFPAPTATTATPVVINISPSISSPPTVTLTPFAIGGGANSVTIQTPFFMNATPIDNDGTVTSLQLFVNGTPSGAAIANPQPPSTLVTYIPTVAGTYNLYVVATDDTGNTAVSSPSVVLTVGGIPAPITVLVRPEDDSVTATVGSPIFLEATAQAQGTNNTQTPTVQFIASAANGQRTTINASRVGTTSTYRAIWTPPLLTGVGTYTVVSSATVGASPAATSGISRRVVVNELVGIAPTVSITVPNTVSSASTANLTATATDSDGAVVSVEFYLNRISIGLATRDQLTNTWRRSASFVGLPLGSTEVVALARDSSGNVAASTTNFINVVAATSLVPTFTTITATPNSVATGRQMQLTANARDTDSNNVSVQYFANGVSLGSSSNANTQFLVNWNPTVSGTYTISAVASDASTPANTAIAAPIEVVVRRNNPIQDDTSFIIQSYSDIANTTGINPLVLADLADKVAAGTIPRTQIVTDLMTQPGFSAPVNLLASYWVLMGQWPTPSNYTTLLAITRGGGLSNGINSILFSNEYFAKNGVVPTVALLNTPTSAIPADTFIANLWTAAGLGAPSPLQNLQFRSNTTATTTLGRGYNSVGLPTALAEFITNTNSTNAALFAKARAAALYYQLDRPPTPTNLSAKEITDAIAVRVDGLVKMADDAARVDSLLKDLLYTYRYVTFLKHPQSLVVAPRSGAIFSVEALGAPPILYQWLFNGTPIANATTSTLSLTNVDTSRVGTYTVVVTTTAGTATSDPATLTLSNAPTRVANISTRGVTSGGNQGLIAGFVIANPAGAPANQTRQMLIRVVGPGLNGAPFNVTGALANPSLGVYNAAGQQILANDNWQNQNANAAANTTAVTALQQATNRIGTFTLANNSLDAAVLATLPPGNYTVQAGGPNANSTGVVLIEVYDATAGNATATSPKAANVATRGEVGTGNNVLIAGFVINGTVSRRVLLRGVGPTLRNFGLGANAVLADPILTLKDSAGNTLRTNDDWSTSDDAAVIAAAAVSGGAFPLANGSKDAAMIVMLAPGAYTVQLSGVNNTTGIGIVEVYDVDP